jgi:hypothetical protein
MTTLTITARWHGRKHPVYLASWKEDVFGQEELDAFHTLADARRWCLSMVGRKDGTWVEKRHGDRVAFWRCEIEEEQTDAT